MARALGRLVMTGIKDGDYTMIVEFSDDSMPAQTIRKTGYYLGHKSRSEMTDFLRNQAALEASRLPLNGEDRTDISLVNVASTIIEDLQTVESQSSTESLKPATPGSYSRQTAMDSVRNVPERSETAVGIQPQSNPGRAMGRAPIVSLRRDCSEDEVEVEIVDQVDEYKILDDRNNLPVSLCALPLEFMGQSIGGSSTKELYLHGKSGGQNIMRPIREWNLVFPETGSFIILVKITTLKNDTDWVKLGKPQSGYKDTAEGVFFVAKFLAFLKKEPHASEDTVRSHLPERDVPLATICEHLRKRYSLMMEYINLDPFLKEADVLNTLASVAVGGEVENKKRMLSDDDVNSDEDNFRWVKKPRKDLGNIGGVAESIKLERVDMTSYAMPEDPHVREYEDEDFFNEDEQELETDLDVVDADVGDSFCILCDDGGDLLCCDGPCMRSFHPHDTAGTNCKSLGFSESAVKEMVGKWLCPNCTYKKHQCYFCGELGASDETLGVQKEVFVCEAACCGKFYHPKCIASKLAPTEDKRRTLAKKIQAGEESFTCPLHSCLKCGKGENVKEDDLKLARCRRCPVAWHKRCLPRNIPFEEEIDEMHPDVRAWALGVVYKRFIIYCTDHKIMKDLATPKRNHVKFPEPAISPEIFKQPKKKPDSIGDAPPANASSSAVPLGRSGRQKHPGAHSLVKARHERLPEDTQMKSEDTRKSYEAAARRAEDIATRRAEDTATRRAEDTATRRTEDTGARRAEDTAGRAEDTAGRAEDTARRAEDTARSAVHDIVAESARRVTEVSVKEKLVLPKHYKEKGINKLMADGKRKSILTAAKNAMAKLRSSTSTVDDATRICSIDSVRSIIQEESILRTFLAPTLHGKRYTSYGRHFTKYEKLQKVVERIQPLIRDSDTIVDFSCGDNSFSPMLRDALSEAGKIHCQFKNFDIFPPRDTFEFERKDWFDTGFRDFGSGDNLVIGLNPPFMYADAFVSHALSMEPRLFVLIVPPLKKKLEHVGYVCLQDDPLLMADKSFYLPGSVHDKHSECLEQGNKESPHFFIYCRKKFYGDNGGKVEDQLQRATSSQPIRMIEKPVKPPPPSDPTANLFIPASKSSQLRALNVQLRQTTNHRAPEKVLHKSARSRDPRVASMQSQPLATRISGPRLPETRMEDEFSLQRHFPDNRSSRPNWYLPPPPPPPPPPHRPSRFYSHLADYPPFHPADHPYHPPCHPPYHPPGHPPYPSYYPPDHHPRHPTLHPYGFRPQNHMQNSQQFFHCQSDHQSGGWAEKEDGELGGWIP